jgi:hypothetical protein
MLADVAAGLSLILLIGVLGMWTRSQSVRDSFVHRSILPSPPWAVKEREVRVTGFRGSAALTVTTYTHLDIQGNWLRAELDAEQGFDHERGDPAPLPMTPGPVNGTSFGAWGFYREVYPAAPMFRDSPGRVARGGRWRFAWPYATTHAAPWWVLAAGLAILPALAVPRWHRAWQRMRRANSGLCPACGYNLRATPDRCPECGTRPPPLV